MNLKISVTLLFSLFTCYVFAQRDTISFDQKWQFAIDLKGEGLAQHWYEKQLSGAKSVNLPHTWNIDDATQNHYGWGWYSHELKAPVDWKNKHLVLQFGAINHTSYIYVNGKLVKETIGDGFNQIKVDLTGKLNFGQTNKITVGVNNAYNEQKVPYSNSFDWPNDGGIIRKVALIVAGKSAVNYIHATPTVNLQNSEGQLNLRLAFAQQPKNLRFAVKITEENQITHKTIYSQQLNATWQGQEAVANLNVGKVNLWHFDFPNLYKVAVQVMEGDKVVDAVTTTVGFKDLHMKDGRIFLNGEAVKLMGTEWTAGSNPNYGFAEPDSIILKHCKMLKAVNTIFTRMHFQQDEIFYDFCDRNGILIQQEIPLWGPETPASKEVSAIAMKQLETMVGNFYNHPSIFSWAVGNELRGRDADIKAMIDNLMKRTAELDKSRMKAYVSNTLTKSFINNPKFVPDGASQGDYLMMNEYGGSWWQLPVAKIGNYLDSIHVSYPNKTFIISEFGICQPNFNGGDERRIQELVYHMATYESRPFVQAAIYFDLTDYRTHYPGTADSSKYKRRIHGVYDMYGNPKPSMKVLREHSSPVEVQLANINGWPKGKVAVTIFGSIGLPQHTVRGYKLYISADSVNYTKGKMYDVPTLVPGQQTMLNVDNAYQGKGFITVVRPNGYVVSQQELPNPYQKN